MLGHILEKYIRQKFNLKNSNKLILGGFVIHSIHVLRLVMIWGIMGNTFYSNLPIKEKEQDESRQIGLRNI